MSRKKTLRDPVVLFASIEREQHESIRELAFENRQSIAEITREALRAYLKKQASKGTESAEREAV